MLKMQSYYTVGVSKRIRFNSFIHILINSGSSDMSNQEALIKVGLAEMRPTNMELIEARSQLLAKEFWQCGDELYEQESWKCIFEMMVSSDAQTVRLHCSRQDIIPTIIHINFAQLQVITFADNGIESIQPLIFLNAPSLYHLDLEMNYINSIRPLRKCFFPQISNLSLTKNRIFDLNILTYCSFPSLQNISLEYLDDTILGEELNWLARLESEHIWNIRRHGNKRIKQGRVEVMATKRYLGMRFSY